MTAFDETAASADELWQWAVEEYENPSPVVRLLLDRFFATVGGAFQLLGPSDRVLEVGCGPAMSSRRLHAMLGGRPFEISDVDVRYIARLKETGFFLPVRQESVLALQRETDSFDCVLLLEVLEHVKEYERALSELVRVSRGYIVVSVPREPIWRMLNMARGKYMRQGGNTPGHVNHWSTRGIATLVGRFADVISVSTPLPWSVVVARVPRKA